MSKGAETDFDHWMQYAVRYFVLVSSGAAIATLSFMGASGKVPLMGALALLSFVASIVVAGLVMTCSPECTRSQASAVHVVVHS
ncbi:hypothetical protein ACLIR7_07290 [Nitratireductor aquimarinus]|uniref:hypothetical protein n=1 Tax=Nitratireductor aquimarinus TaxID=889300 RepID=UPI00398EB950